MTFKNFEDARTIYELDKLMLEYNSSTIKARQVVDLEAHMTYGMRLQPWYEARIDELEKGEPVESLNEYALYEASRKDLPADEFGIPSMRKYPLHDKAHVLSAIKFFNHVDHVHEKVLAKNINKKIKRFNMKDEVHVGAKNRFQKYWKEGANLLDWQEKLKNFWDERGGTLLSECIPVPMGPKNVYNETDLEYIQLAYSLYEAAIHSSNKHYPINQLCRKYFDENVDNLYELSIHYVSQNMKTPITQVYAEAADNEFDKLKRNLVAADLDTNKVNQKLSTQVKLDDTIKRLRSECPYPDLPRAIMYPNIVPAHMVVYKGTDGWIKEFNEKYTELGIMAFSEADMKVWHTKLSKAIDENNIKDITGLGWIPGCDMRSSESYVGAWATVLESTKLIADVYNLTRYQIPEEDQLNEALSWEEDTKLYPVYIVLVRGNSPFSHVIRTVTQSEYTHASMGFESDLSELYSYNLVNGLRATGGVSFESIGQYIDEYDKANLYVGMVFLNAMQMRKMKNNIDFYVAHYKDSKYSVLNCLRVVLSPHIPNDAYALQMICSQFVTSMLRLVNIDISGGSGRIMTPKDIRMANDPRVYIVYEGPILDYDSKKVDKIVQALLRKPKVALLGESGKYCPWKYEDDSYIVDMITPRSIFEERAIPVQLSKEGDLIIETPKDFQREYMECHRNLSIYEKEPTHNTEGIKVELCRLLYINSQLEKKIAKTKADKKKRYIDIRARVLNDYNRYLAILTVAEPGVDIEAIYRDSDYYDGTSIVKASTFEGIKTLIQKLAK